MMHNFSFLTLAFSLMFFFAAAGVAHASLPAPTLSISPSTIARGQSATLTWDSGPNSNLNNCWASGFSNTYTQPGYWTETWVCGEWFGCFPVPMWVPPQTVENPSGSVTVSPNTTTTYTYSCNRTETFAIYPGYCYGYATDNGWGWGNCWARWDGGGNVAQALCQQRGYNNYSSYAAGGPGGRVCSGSRTDWADWRCDSSCSSSCGGLTMTSLTCTNPPGAPVTRSVTLTVQSLPDLTATIIAP